MLKLAKRTAQAEKQVARRAAVRRKALRGIDALQNKSQRVVLNEEIQVQERQARRLRKETWTMGPLAPRRNHAASVADDMRRGRKSPTTQFGLEMFANERVPHWGTISMHRSRMQGELVSEAQAKARCAWAGTPNALCLAPGDRVRIMEGAYKGSIGPIREINTDQGTVIVEGVAKSNITFPETMVQDSAASVFQAESSIPINAIRLVHPLQDPATGTTRDVIIRELKPVSFQLDRNTRRLRFTRVVPGINVRIPWPKAPGADKKKQAEEQDQPNDTLRIDTEQVTFVPTLLKPPAPETVLDELRNRYSRFRTRHTPEYIARKEAEEAEAKLERQRRANSAKIQRGRAPVLSPEAMRTPLQEFHIQEKAARRARGQPVLTDDMLEKIGRLMAQNTKLPLPPLEEESSASSTSTTTSDNSPL